MNKNNNSSSDWNDKHKKIEMKIQNGEKKLEEFSDLDRIQHNKWREYEKGCIWWLEWKYLWQMFTIFWSKKRKNKRTRGFWEFCFWHNRQRKKQNYEKHAEIEYQIQIGKLDINSLDFFDQKDHKLRLQEKIEFDRFAINKRIAEDLDSWKITLDDLSDVNKKDHEKWQTTIKTSVWDNQHSSFENKISLNSVTFDELTDEEKKHHVEWRKYNEEKQAKIGKEQEITLSEYKDYLLWESTFNQDEL